MVFSFIGRHSLLLLAPIAAFFLSTQAHAAVDPLKAARACRKQAANQLAKLVGASFKAVDTCHKKRNACRKDNPKCAADAAATCNALPVAVDPSSAAALAKKCPTALLDGLLSVPDELAEQIAMLTAIRVQTSAVAVQGNPNIADDSKDDGQKQEKKQKRKCHDTIGKERTKLAKKILARAVKCQNEADKEADVFGPRDDDAFCGSTPTVDELKAAAQQKILKACTRPAKLGGTLIEPSDVDSCTQSFPACVTESATTAAETLANEPYTLVSSCSPVLRSSQRGPRGLFQIVRRFFFFPVFGKPITKIPPIAKKKMVRSRPLRRDGDPPPLVLVNRSAIHPGGGRSLKIGVPTGATATSKLRIGISAGGDSCDAEVFEIDLGARAAAGELSSDSAGRSFVDLELEFLERDEVPDVVTIRTALTDDAGEQTSAAAVVNLASRGNLELVANLNPTDSSLPRLLTPVGQRLFFVARSLTQDQIWVAEGDPPVLRSFQNPSGGTFRDLTNVGNDTLFFGHCVSDTGTDCTLWKISGADTAATQVAEIRSSCIDTPTRPVGLIGKLIFASEGTDGSGCEPRVSNGTNGGTIRLADIGSGRANGKPRDLTILPPNAFFVADEFKENSRNQIWKTDGTPGGTVSRTTFAPGVALDQLEAFDGMLYFRVDEKTLYRLQPTTGGQVPVKTFDDGIDKITAGQNGLYFVGCEGSDGCELWRLPPGSLTPSRISTITPDDEDPFIGDLTPVGGEVFFRACSPAAGCELWRSDAASGGSRQVADIARGTASSLPNDLVNVRGRLYFEATDGERGPEIWESDGSEAGTVRIRDFRLGDNGVAGGFISSPVGLDRSLYFPRLALSASDPTDPQANTGEELWRLETFEGSAPPPTPTPTPAGGPTPSATPVVVPTGGPCCTQHPAKGCVETSCAACVCALEAECCSVAWDGSCAARASAECLANCSCVAPTPPQTPTPSPTITNNPNSDCCSASNRRSCSILACAQQVCGDDAFCCGADNGSWDNVCVQAARSNIACGCPTSVPTNTPTPTATPTPTKSGTPTRTATPTPQPSPVLPVGTVQRFSALLSGVGAGTLSPRGELQYWNDTATVDLNRPPLQRCFNAANSSACESVADCPGQGASCESFVVGPEDFDGFDVSGKLDDPSPRPAPQYRAEIAIGFPAIAHGADRLVGGAFALRAGGNPVLGPP